MHQPCAGYPVNHQLENDLYLLEHTCLHTLHSHPRASRRQSVEDQTTTPPPRSSHHPFPIRHCPAELRIHIHGFLFLNKPNLSERCRIHGSRKNDFSRADGACCHPAIRHTNKPTCNKTPGTLYSAATFAFRARRRLGLVSRVGVWGAWRGARNRSALCGDWPVSISPLRTWRDLQIRTRFRWTCGAKPSCLRAERESDSNFRRPQSSREMVRVPGYVKAIRSGYTMEGQQYCSAWYVHDKEASNSLRGMRLPWWHKVSGTG